MKAYIFKQFLRNKGYLIALFTLLVAGLCAIYTGKKFLDRNESVITASADYQQQSIKKNVALHPDNMGLLLYYLKFNFVDATPRIAALNIGMRDLNPSIQSVTIRNLEEQKHNSDFYNPANAAVGNFDFSFVLIFLFPLVIITFCYNIISEDQERGVWKLLSTQSGNVEKVVNVRLLVRYLAISIVYVALLLIAVLWIQLPLDFNLGAFFLAGWLYISFWFMLCRWIISYQRSSAQNALTLVVIWVCMNFIVPMTFNIIIQKIYPVKESLQAQIKQREGYHNKWDEAKAPTMAQFYKAYPQFKNYTVAESETSSYIWYYAMQHAGDMESAEAADRYDQKMRQRNNAAVFLSYFLPNIHTQLVSSEIAGTGMDNHLNYAQALKRFHEIKRLFFYPYIFSKKNADAVDWSKQTVEEFRDTDRVTLAQLFLPYLLFIVLLFLLTRKKYKALC